MPKTKQQKRDEAAQRVAFDATEAGLKLRAKREAQHKGRGRKS